MGESWSPYELREAMPIPLELSERRSEDQLVYVVPESVDQLELRAFELLVSQTQVDGRTSVRLDQIDVGITAAQPARSRDPCVAKGA